MGFSRVSEFVADAAAKQAAYSFCDVPRRLVKL